ncbi:hypothetical protein HOB94_00400 [bacterium]|nr:hypothetical protein [bacterium]MBT6778726.1 hypothetical protein [bacterium]
MFSEFAIISDISSILLLAPSSKNILFLSLTFKELIQGKVSNHSNELSNL